VRLAQLGTVAAMTTPREFLVLLSKPDNDMDELDSFLAEDLQFIHSAALMHGESRWVVSVDEITPAYLREIASACATVSRATGL
jgi:hypothetical protein